MVGKRWPLRAAFVLYVLLVVWVSLVPGDGRSFWHIDKIGHFLAYSGMVIAGSMAFPSKAAQRYVVLFAIALGTVLEGGQYFVTSRDMSFIDGIANTLGALAGYFFYQRFGDRLADRIAHIFG